MAIQCRTPIDFLNMMDAADLDARLTALECRALRLLCRVIRNRERNACFPKVSYLAQLLNVSERAAQYAIANLEKAGYLGRKARILNGRQISNSYVFYAQPPIATQPVAGLSKAEEQADTLQDTSPPGVQNTSPPGVHQIAGRNPVESNPVESNPVEKRARGREASPDRREFISILSRILPTTRVEAILAIRDIRKAVSNAIVAEGLVADLEKLADPIAAADQMIVHNHLTPRYSNPELAPTKPGNGKSAYRQHQDALKSEFIGGKGKSAFRAHQDALKAELWERDGDAAIDLDTHDFWETGGRAH